MRRRLTTLLRRWREAMRAWWVWLVGERPAPGRGTRIFMAGTAAIFFVALFAFSAVASSAFPRHHKVKVTNTTLNPAIFAPSSTTTTLKGYALFTTTTVGKGKNAKGSHSSSVTTTTVKPGSIPTTTLSAANAAALAQLKAALAHSSTTTTTKLASF